MGDFSRYPRPSALRIYPGDAVYRECLRDVLAEFAADLSQVCRPEVRSTSLLGQAREASSGPIPRDYAIMRGIAADKELTIERRGNKSRPQEKA